MTTLKSHISNLWSKLSPYKDIIIFVVTLIVANYAWKWTFTGDEYGDQVTWLGLDVTAPFEIMACHVASAVYGCLSLLRDTVYMADAHTIRFASGTGTTIIWGCSGLKQSFIWLCLIMTVRSMPGYEKQTWWHKAWFIPFGWLCCYLFNILRIVLISLFIEFHPNLFPLLHDYVFKYLFYAMLFGLWVWFVEKIRPSVSTR